MGIVLHKKGSIKADGSEQIIVEISEPSIFSGYISLGKMLSGDSAVIRQYMRINDSFEKYAEETYSDVQSNPIVYIKPKEVSSSIRITLQQIAGGYKTFEYEFNKNIERKEFRI